MKTATTRSLLALLLFAACGVIACRATGPERRPRGEGTAHSSGSDPSATGVRGAIGLSVPTLGNSFFARIADSVEAEAARQHYRLILTNCDHDAARQDAQVEDFIVRQVSAIILVPSDPGTIGATIRKANRAGIPVFTLDVACQAPEASVVSHIAADNHGGGRLAARAMIEALGDAGGKVAILHFDRARSCVSRVAGFREAIGEHNRGRTSGGIRLVAKLPGGGTRVQSLESTVEVMAAHADLAGIFAVNDPSALGARTALERLGKAEEVTIIGFDGQEDGRRAIRDGKIYADPIQRPDELGRRVVETIMKYFEGEEVEREILIPFRLYRKTDAEKDPLLD